MWRIFVFYNTRNSGGRPHYINMIDKDSVRVLIDTVYEPHYEHYKDDFGKTFAGFFSDEPSFGNTLGYDFNESIGRRRDAYTLEQRCSSNARRTTRDRLEAVAANALR